MPFCAKIYGVEKYRNKYGTPFMPFILSICTIEHVRALMDKIPIILIELILDLAYELLNQIDGGEIHENDTDH